jgi:MSHA biogenesis protein MshQ
MTSVMSGLFFLIPQTNTTTGACVALFPNNTPVTVDLSVDCESPASCISRTIDSMTNANDLAIINNGNIHYPSEFGTYSSHSLMFGTDSTATIAIKYPDAGKIKIHAKNAITLLDGKVKTMTGNTNSFVVRPFGITMVIADEVNASNNAGPIYKMAGQAFNTVITARQ